MRLQAVTHAVQQRLRIDCRECDKSPTLRPLSFPRRRESTFCAWVGMDSRLRGNDDEEALQAVLKPSFLGYFSAFSAQLLRLLRSAPAFPLHAAIHPQTLRRVGYGLQPNPAYLTRTSIDAGCGAK